jgi:two-component system nitrogen regulation response regulator NtrX
MSKGTVLVIDDEESIRDSFKMIFEFEGYRLLLAASGEQGLTLAEGEDPDIIFLDVKLPGIDGLQVLEKFKEKRIQAPVVMISGHGTIDTAVQATKLGAFNFLEKPLERERLLLLARNAIQTRRLQQENTDLRLRFARNYKMIGDSAPMRHLRETIAKTAPTNATVLITGESGTGKELIARALHKNSRRADNRFVQVNCAAIPEELIESELFGHEKGSFTGATEKKIGKFQQADGGTIFLDEVADMSAKTQAKVLRVLEEGEVERIGGTKTERVDVRVIAATNKDLPKMIAEGHFREDLYFRLNVVPLPAPPLRERLEDIPALVAHFTETFCEENNFRSKKFTQEALDALARRPLKGNVRELRNLVERALILSEGDEINPSDLPPEAGAAPVATAAGGSFLVASTLREFKENTERAFIVAKLRDNNWNVLQTAKSIDTPRSNLYKKIEQYGISQELDG